MKKVSLVAIFSALFILVVGCQSQQRQEPVSSLTPITEKVETQIIPEIQEQDESEIATRTFRGSWFDIEYPENFTARPTALTTDEAYFLSPDGTVEFFVYSPLWSGDPESYLKISPTEELVSEKTDQSDDQIVHWVTIRAKDGSYHRSFVSIKEQVGTGSDLHHVFGIKYQDNASYQKYEAEYLAFKESLKQYAD